MNKKNEQQSAFNNNRYSPDGQLMMWFERQ